MLTINGKDIRDAAIYGENFFPYYKSHVKKHLDTGFGIQFETFGQLGNFLTSLGANAMYAYSDRNSTRTDAISPDEARMLTNDLQIDPLGVSGIVAYFPGWELTND